MTFWQNCKTLLVVLCFSVLPLMACHAQNDVGDGQPQSLPSQPLILHTAKGNLMFQIEIAKTPEQSERGLMYRKELASNKGMIFLFPTVQEVNFWMENTLIPLDMLFINADGKIVSIKQMAKPLDLTPIPSGFPVKAVIEIFGGESAKQGIAVGDTIDPAILKTE